MKIKINNKDKILPNNISIEELLLILEHKDNSSIAIAINNEVIPKEQWDTIKLSDGDNLLIIHATCGG